MVCAPVPTVALLSIMSELLPPLVLCTPLTMLPGWELALLCVPTNQQLAATTVTVTTPLPLSVATRVAEASG